MGRIYVNFVHNINLNKKSQIQLNWKDEGDSFDPKITAYLQPIFHHSPLNHLLNIRLTLLDTHLFNSFLLTVYFPPTLKFMHFDKPRKLIKQTAIIPLFTQRHDKSFERRVWSWYFRFEECWVVVLFGCVSVQS